MTVDSSRSGARDPTPDTRHPENLASAEKELTHEPRRLFILPATMRRLAGGAVVCAVVLALWAAPAWGQSGLPLALPIPDNGPQPQPYGTNDFGGFRNILPPGQNGFDNLTQLGAFEATGARPAHNDDQLGMYANLVHAVPG